MYKNIGSVCRKYRLEKGYRLRDVADDLNYSIRNVCAFEQGRNDNGRILLWYFKHGITIDHFTKGVE